MTGSAGALCLLLVSAAALAAQQVPCERPACLPGARWDGSHCRFERARPGGTGYTPTCGDSATLDGARGICVANRCAQPPTIKAAPISGGTPGTVIPRAAPIAGAAPGVVGPRGAAVNLSARAGLTSASRVECDGGIHASPVFVVEVSNRSSIATGGPVTIRAIDARRPEVRADTVINPLGPSATAMLPYWKLRLPPDLRYGSEYVRDFDIIVDPDGRFADPDRRDNITRVSKILILCRRP